MKDVVIVSAVRTAIGNFGGSLKELSAVELGKIAAQEAIIRAGIESGSIDEVVIGNVLSAGHGQNIARQVAVMSGIPETVPAMTINMVCGSGLRAVSLAAQMIKAGDSDVVLAGGTESMSNAAYILKNARFGMKMGHETIIDTMIQDGLWDAFNDYHMGITAENIAEKWNITREMQDEFAAKSQQKAEAAMLILMSREKAESLGVKVLATVKSYASAGIDPSIMGYGVVPACKKAMEAAGVTAKVTDKGFLLKEIAGNTTVDEVKNFTAADLIVSGDLKIMTPFVL